jgi:hypothetical protein
MYFSGRFSRDCLLTGQQTTPESARNQNMQTRKPKSLENSEVFVKKI